MSQTVSYAEHPAYLKGLRASGMTATPVCPYDSIYEGHLYKLWYQGFEDGRKILTNSFHVP